MNLGLVRKAVRESWVLTLVVGLALFAIELLLPMILPNFQAGLAEQIIRIPFLRALLSALLGADIAEALGPNLTSLMAWVHPVALTLFGAHAIVFCTRLPVGEIDRGTIDTLLGLPISRTEAWVSETAVWLAEGLVLVGFAVAGHLLGSMGLPPEQQLPGRALLPILVNLYCLYAATGAVALIVSSLSERRGRAIGIVFGLFLGSFFLNFLTQIWAPARYLSFLGLLEYYRPFSILRGDGWPLADIAVLLGLAGSAWTVGLRAFVRRDVHGV